MIRIRCDPAHRVALSFFLLASITPEMKYFLQQLFAAEIITQKKYKLSAPSGMLLSQPV